MRGSRNKYCYSFIWFSCNEFSLNTYTLCQATCETQNIRSLEGPWDTILHTDVKLRQQNERSKGCFQGMPKSNTGRREGQERFRTTGVYGMNGAGWALLRSRCGAGPPAPSSAGTTRAHHRRLRYTGLLTSSRLFPRSDNMLTSLWEIIGKHLIIPFFILIADKRKSSMSW